MMNRRWNASNPHQGTFQRALCVCSAGLLRSPTIAWILSNEPFNFNTRAVGTSQSHALIPIDEVHVAWAHVVVFVNEETHRDALNMLGEHAFSENRVWVLNIPDAFPFRDPKLVEIATRQLEVANEAGLNEPVVFVSGV